MAQRCGLEVGFEEIAMDLLQARFWTVSGLQITQPESLHLSNLLHRL